MMIFLNYDIPSSVFYSNFVYFLLAILWREEAQNICRDSEPGGEEAGVDSGRRVEWGDDCQMERWCK